MDREQYKRLGTILGKININIKKSKTYVEGISIGNATLAVLTIQSDKTMDIISKTAFDKHNTNGASHKAIYYSYVNTIEALQNYCEAKSKEEDS